jgi:hypothetical protein
VNIASLKRGILDLDVTFSTSECKGGHDPDPVQTGHFWLEDLNPSSLRSEDFELKRILLTRNTKFSGRRASHFVLNFKLFEVEGKGKEKQSTYFG